MKRFQFKLARLARVRRIEEEQARVAWQAAEAEARNSEARLREAQVEVSAATQSLRIAQSDAQLSPLAILSIDDTVARLVRRVALFRQEATLRRAAATAKRTPWQKLRTELEGLARLEQKARTRHRIEDERRASLEMDQLASERAARGGNPFQRGPAPQLTPETWPTGTN